jgi:5-methylcytosine-specific restriction endonuclease McrA
MNRERIIQTTDCPKCKAKAGERCGQNRVAVHAARLRAAQGFCDTTVVKKRKPDVFYETWEWKAARYTALRRYGRICACCGWEPGNSAGNWLVVDHIKPRALRPDLALNVDNLQVLCNDCNMGKGRRGDEYRK